MTVADNCRTVIPLRQKQGRSRIATLPNAISAYRLAVAPLILCMIISGHRTAFTALVIISLVTDAFDGYIARHWHQETDLGTKLDSFADLATYALLLCGMLMFEWPYVYSHKIAFGVMIGFYLASQLLSLARFHRLVTLHLYSSKIMGVVLSAFFILFFLGARSPVLLYGVLTLSILSNIEEILVLSLLRNRSSNVRGIYWVLRDRLQQK